MRIPFLPLAFSAAGLIAGPTAPVPLPEQPTCLLGPAAVQTFAGGAFFHLKAQATQAELPDRMKQLVPRLLKALAAAKVATLGPLQVVYHGMTQDPTRPFDLEVGVLVPKGTEPSGEGLVRTLAPFTCATQTFTGSLGQVGKAYESIYPALLSAGRIPSGETRQMVLFFEGDASTNNMLLVQVGLRPMH